MLRRSIHGLLLGLMMGPTYSAIPSQGIAVIVGAGNSASISVERLALIYRRKKNFWDDGSRIQPVNLPAAHPLRHEFSLRLFNHTPEEMDDYWKDMYFHGIQPPFVLASEEAVVRFVAATPGAIGYISPHLADHRVRVILLQDGGRTLSP